MTQAQQMKAKPTVPPTQCTKSILIQATMSACMHALHRSCHCSYKLGKMAFFMHATHARLLGRLLWSSLARNFQMKRREQ